jgi:hypothetical protein
MLIDIEYGHTIKRCQIKFVLSRICKVETRKLEKINNLYVFNKSLIKETIFQPGYLETNQGNTHLQHFLMKELPCIRIRNHYISSL